MSHWHGKFLKDLRYDDKDTKKFNFCIQPWSAWAVAGSGLMTVVISFIKTFQECSLVTLILLLVLCMKIRTGHMRQIFNWAGLVGFFLILFILMFIVEVHRKCVLCPEKVKILIFKFLRIISWIFYLYVLSHLEHL